MATSKWIEEADRKTSCSKCKARIEVGERFYYKSRGIYLCELCGSLAEHEEPEVGRIEQGVLNDLSQLPEDASGTTLAQNTLYMARSMDAGDVAPRDIAPFNKEMRQNIAALREMFPDADENDVTDQARSKRDRFLGATYEED